MKIDQFLQDLKIIIIEKSSEDEREFSLFRTKEIDYKFDEIYKKVMSDNKKLLENPAMKKLLNSGVDLEKANEKEILKYIGADELAELQNLTDNKNQDEIDVMVLNLYRKNQLDEMVNYLVKKMKKLFIDQDLEFDVNELILTAEKQIADETFKILFDLYSKKKK